MVTSIKLMPLILNHGTVMVHPLAARKEVPGTCYIGSLGSPQSHSRFFKIEGKEVSCVCQELNSDCLAIQPVACLLLH